MKLTEKLVSIFCLILVSFFSLLFIGCDEGVLLSPETPTVVYSISPTSGTTDTTITIVGANLSGTLNVKVGEKLTTFEKVTDTEVVFKMPDLGTDGTYAVSVITENGESNSKDFTFSTSTQTIKRLFVPNANNNSVRSFDITWTDGNIAPQQIFTQSLSDPRGVYVANNELFVTSCGTNSVRVYNATAEDNPAPLRTFSNSILAPIGICVVNNELFVSNYGTNSVTVYNATAEDNPLPLRTFSTSISNVRGIYVANNELFVANYGTNSVTVYNATAEGNPAPLRTFSNSLAGPGGVYVANNELFVSNLIAYNVRVYNATAEGNPAPLRTFSNSVASPAGVCVVNNELFVASLGNHTITVYPALAEDNPAPIRTLGGANTGLSSPRMLYIGDLTISMPALQVNNTLRGVELSWQDDPNFKAHSFYVWRKEPNTIDTITGKIIENQYIKISDLAIIPEKGSYTYTDTYAESDKAYSYKIEYIGDAESRFSKIVTISAK